MNADAVNGIKILLAEIGSDIPKIESKAETLAKGGTSLNCQQATLGEVGK